MHVQLYDFRCTALVCNSVTRQQLTCMLTGVALSYMLVYVFRHTSLCKHELCILCTGCTNSSN
jgi:hypothetical protein